MRYYANKSRGASEVAVSDTDRFPEIDECVVVQVRQIQEMGAYGAYAYAPNVFVLGPCRAEIQFPIDRRV